MNTSDVANLSFEEAFRSLQEVVDRMEKGNLSLEESIALFELGTELVRHCTDLLDKAELRIKTLTQELEIEPSPPVTPTQGRVASPSDPLSDSFQPDEPDKLRGDELQ